MTEHKAHAEPEQKIRHEPQHGNGSAPAAAPPRLKKALYEPELFRLQAELVTMQEWVRETKARIVVVFEGRDAAGKGGAIKRVSEFLNPRIADDRAPRSHPPPAGPVVLPALRRVPTRRR